MTTEQANQLRNEAAAEAETLCQERNANRALATYALAQGDMGSYQDYTDVADRIDARLADARRRQDQATLAWLESLRS